MSDRVREDFESSILLFLQNKRVQQLEDQIADTCYGKNSLSFMQAQQCESHFKKNDYALNSLRDFWFNYSVPYMLQHDQCSQSAAITSLPTNTEKDRAFLACHNEWVRVMKDTVAQDL